MTPVEGAQLLVRATGETMLRRNAAWEAGILRVREVQVDGQTVLRGRQPPIAAPTGGSVIDAESRSAICDDPVRAAGPRIDRKLKFSRVFRHFCCREAGVRHLGNRERN